MAKFMFIDENGSGSEVLGVAEGRNEREALKNLVRKSPWLEEYDYDGINSVRLLKSRTIPYLPPAKIPYP